MEGALLRLAEGLLPAERQMRSTRQAQRFVLQCISTPPTLFMVNSLPVCL
ncbi:hypothetical protein SynRCC2555_02435 [Synechococcus sp. WH 8101]|nr:hypothetical protein SynRCC2555_02435 [Synechococcus sp. WH 8101]